MPLITIYYMAQIRRAVGRSKETREINAGEPLVFVLKQLGAQYGPSFQQFVFDSEGQPLKTLLYIVGNEQVDPLQVFLQGGEEITLLTPMAGGQEDLL